MKYLMIAGVASVAIVTGVVGAPDLSFAQRRFDDRDDPRPRLRTVLPPRVVPRHHHHVDPRPFVGRPPARGVVIVTPPPYAYPPSYAPPPTVIYDSSIYIPPPPMAPPVPPTPSVPPTPGSEIIEFPEGRYELRGDGVTTPYQWVWIPKAPTAPPPSASEPSAPTTLYRWTDESGAVHWTDRWEAVPERFRERATKVPS